MKTVVAALIEKDGKYLIARRALDGDQAGKWEFPGGKVEAGESEVEALEREIIEELNTVIEVGKLLATAQLDENMIIKLYACKHKLGSYQLKVHTDAVWVQSLAEINGYDMIATDFELLAQTTTDTRRPSLGELKVNDSYANADIMRIFLVSGQGGMRRSRRANSLILFALHNTGNPYEDKWGDDGSMHYTGMGLSGDQSIDYAQNKTLAESRDNGVDVHLFESFEPNEYIYRGRVRLQADPYSEVQKDENDRERQVVKFPLKQISLRGERH